LLIPVVSDQDPHLSPRVYVGYSQPLDREAIRNEPHPDFVREHVRPDGGPW
jgi:hypothetical protein